MQSHSKTPFRIAAALEAILVSACLVLLVTAGAGLFGAPAGLV